MSSRLVTRLTAPIGAVCLLLFVTAVGAAWYVRDMQRTMSAVLSSNVASVRAALELEIAVREVDARLDRYLTTGNRSHLEAVPQLRGRTDDAIRAAEAVAFTPAEQAVMLRVRSGHTRFFMECDRAAAQPPGEDPRPRVAELSDAVLEKEILEPAREYLRLNEGMLTQASRTNESLPDRVTAGLVGLGVSGAVGGLFGGWAIAAAVRRTILRTEARLRDTAERLSSAVPEADSTLAPGPTADPLERVTGSVAAVLGRLHESERAALRAEQLAWVGQMAAGVAHEVRNPLMAIKVLVQAAADPKRDRPFRPRDLEVLEQEIVRLEQIVTGFLDFARPPRPDKRPVDLGPLLAQAVDGVRVRAELQGVRIEAAPPGSFSLNADPNQLRQVLYNLLFNALDSLPAGGAVRVSAAGEGGPLGAPAVAVVRVEDDGAGLPAGMGDHIFAPFITTKESGLGLGLSICRRIVESHGGTIQAAGRAGGGAVFTVRLPAGRPAAVVATRARS